MRDKTCCFMGHRKLPETGREKKALCCRHRAFHSITGSNPSNNGSSKNSLKLIPSPSQSF